MCALQKQKARRCGAYYILNLNCGDYWFIHRFHNPFYLFSIEVEVPDHIEMLDLTLSKPKMRVDVEKMERAFVNIIKDAVDAMPKEGTLTIRSKEANGNLEISFVDTGIGMSKDVVEKIWTPLFTTKAKGMGFGLTICKRIVEAHEGEIYVESTVGKGTVFTLKLPTTLKTEEGAKISLISPEPLSSSEH